MDTKEIKQFIEEEFKELIKPCGDNYHKLMERVLVARFRILYFLLKGTPPEVQKVEGVKEEGNDSVNHPSHYTSHPSGIECIEITRHYCFSIGNAIKYLWRAGLKKEMGLEDKEKEIEDLRKAIWYINDRIKQLSHGNQNNRQKE